MRDVLDVAAYILKEAGEMSTMKLQKLAYYSQAYSLVSLHKPLFGNRIEAWANGPVMPDLFRAHKRRYVVGYDTLDFHETPALLDASERACVDHVLACLLPLTGSQLSTLSHSEDPWIDARNGLEAGEPSTSRITNEAILAYYSSSRCSNRVFGPA